MPQAHLTQTDGMKTTIRIRDHELIADEPIRDGGTDLGASPTELLIAALASCAAITAKMYAQRKGWALEGVEIDVTMERFKAADYPSYVGEADRVNEFRQRITFKGDLTDEQRQRLLEIAGKCPVHKILTEPNIMFEELWD
jgi:putative redox protein